MDFKNWFCLKERESFTIDPRINPADARFYFGRAQLDQRMKNQLKRAFTFAPSGKTSTEPMDASAATELHNLRLLRKTTNRVREEPN